MGNVSTITHNKGKFDLIYFAKFGDAIKIGYSTDPKARIIGLQVGAHEKLECLLVISGARTEERELHKKFKELNTGSTREWFYYKEPIKKFIEDNLHNDRRYEFDLLDTQSEFEGNEQLKRLRRLNHFTLEDVGKELQLTAQSIREREEREKYGCITINCLRETGASLGYKLEYRFVKNQ